MQERTSHRFQDLIDAATKVFVERGYRRTQMADVAQVMGVAKGTLYLYVESKEALFDVACRFADAPRPLQPPALPVPTPPKGATLEYITAQLSRTPVLPLLRSLLEQKRGADARAGLEEFVGALYDELADHRRSLKLIGQSARDLPELAEVWFGTTRAGVVGLLTKLLEAGVAAGSLTPMPDAGAAARAIVETAVFWAIHRHWDPHPQTVDEAAAKATVLQFTVGALTPSRARSNEKGSAS